MNKAYLTEIAPTQALVNLCQWQDIEADEMWSFVGSKKIERWLWHAIDHTTGMVLAHVLSPHQDSAFLELKALLEPFGMTQFYTDPGARISAICIPLSDRQVAYSNH